MNWLLIHGAGHGPWCWALLADLLHEAGDVVAVADLPADDVDATLVDDVAAALAALDAARLDATGDPWVVVGHSLGSIAATATVGALQADRGQATVLVHLAGIVSAAGRTLAEQAAEDAERDTGLGDGDLEVGERSMRFTAEAARRVLYHDCPPEVADDAVARLRAQRYLSHDRLDADPANGGRVVSVVCRDDRIVRPTWSAHVARTRLGVEPTWIDGGHSPMLSRPHDLAAVLRAAVEPHVAALGSASSTDGPR